MRGRKMRKRWMMAIAVAAATQAMAQASPQQQGAGQSSAAPMEGGCGSYSVDLSSEMRLMAGEAVKVDAGRDVAGAPVAATGRALEVHLRPQTEVELAAAPAQDRGGPERKAGLVRLGTMEAGDWRVSVDRFAWIDLVGGGQLMESTTFAMERGCATVLKTVVFHVPAAMPVVLELTGADEATVRVLVSRAK